MLVAVHYSTRREQKAKSLDFPCQPLVASNPELAAFTLRVAEGGVDAAAIAAWLAANSEVFDG